MTPSNRAHLAREIIANEVFTEAFDAIERSIEVEWKSSPPDAWKRREALYERLQALQDVKAQLSNFIHTAALETTAKGKHDY